MIKYKVKSAVWKKKFQIKFTIGFMEHCFYFRPGYISSCDLHDFIT